MKEKRWLISHVIFLILISVLHVSFSAIILDISPRIEISAKKYDINYGDSIKYADFTKLKGYNISFQKETSGNILDEIVNIKITDAGFVYFKDFTMTNGSFFTQEASRAGFNVAVISEALSFTLYGTLHAVGNELEINGFTYTVCGVFKQNWLYETLSSNGKEDVFIPSNSDLDRTYAGESGIQRIYFSADSHSSESFAANDIKSELMKITLNTDNYIIKDFAKVNAVISQFFSMSLFAVSVLLIVLMLKYMYRHITENVVFFKDELRALTPYEILIKNSAKFVSSALIYMALLVVVVVLFRMCAFSLYVPGKYLPPDSLFDYHFYTQIALNIIQSENILYSYKKSSYEIFYQFEFITSIIFTLSEIILAVKIMFKLSNIFYNC